MVKIIRKCSGVLADDWVSLHSHEYQDSGLHYSKMVFI